MQIIYIFWIFSDDPIALLPRPSCNTLEALFKQLLQQRVVSVDKLLQLITKLKEASWLDSYMADNHGFVQGTLDQIKNTLSEVLPKAGACWYGAITGEINGQWTKAEGNLWTDGDPTRRELQTMPFSFSFLIKKDSCTEGSYQMAHFFNGWSVQKDRT
jgi:hypothetical protein